MASEAPSTTVIDRDYNEPVRLDYHSSQTEPTVGEVMLLALIKLDEELPSDLIEHFQSLPDNPSSQIGTNIDNYQQIKEMGPDFLAGMRSIIVTNTLNSLTLTRPKTKENFELAKSNLDLLSSLATAELHLTNLSDHTGD